LIAEQEGFFLREGSTSNGSSAAHYRHTQALVADRRYRANEFGESVAANSAGADLIVIAGDSTCRSTTLIVHPSIKSYADLKGKRLAITGRRTR